EITTFMLEHIEIKKNILDDPKYDYLFSVEVVNEEVLKGVPFREAYRNIGLVIEDGSCTPQKAVNHTHAGSIGNLCTAEIRQAFEGMVERVGFDRIHGALNALLVDN